MTASLSPMRPTLIAALVTACLFGAACGDDDGTTSTTAAPATGSTATEVGTDSESDGGEGGDEDSSGGGAPGSDPESTLEDFFTSGDPELICVELATEELVALVWGDEQGCRDALVANAIPDSIEIEDLEESDGEATATVTPGGGPNKGIPTEVTLVDEDGTWRVESIQADVPAGP